MHWVTRPPRFHHPLGFLFDFAFYSIFSCCCPLLFLLSLCQLLHNTLCVVTCQFILNHTHGLFVPPPLRCRRSRSFSVTMLALFFFVQDVYHPTIYLRIVFAPTQPGFVFRVPVLALLQRTLCFFSVSATTSPSFRLVSIRYIHVSALP